MIFFLVGVIFSLLVFVFPFSLWFSFSEEGTWFMVCALLLRHVKQMPINEKMSMSKYISDLCRYKDTIHYIFLYINSKLNDKYCQVFQLQG